VSPEVEALLTRYIASRLAGDVPADPERLCADRPDLLSDLRECIRLFERADRTLSAGGSDDGMVPARTESLPAFEGFRVMEHLGRGGGGDVYKAEDLTLGRIVAVKILRPDSPLRDTAADFLREARSLALFEDLRIVRLLELRARHDPPLLVMEYVDGFELDVTGPSLEFAQRARIMAEIAEAVHRAHQLGIEHRDLKPANILLDARLQPKILDFGLSRAAGSPGQGRGTPGYMAPEQLEAGRAIDVRTDVYALGVVFYELLCGSRPYRGDDVAALVTAIRAGEPRLPVEVDPAVPEPLQAIALKAMEREPGERYPSAQEMAADLRRFLDGRPVLARPTLYQSALGRRLRPHLDQIREWLRIRLIYPHEADELLAAYRRLETREDDWIVHSRVLSFSQIALYLGAFLMVCGSLLYFNAYLLQAVAGLARPILVLGLPFVGLNVWATMLFRRERRAVAVAFYLAAAVLLPMFLIIFFRESALWPVSGQPEDHFFGDSGIANRQLQVAALLAGAWAFALARRTRTIALSAVSVAFVVLFHLSLLADFGLRRWLEEGTWDRLALHLAPLVGAVAAAGWLFERHGQTWFARAAHYTGAGLFVLTIELLALNGKTFQYLGITLAPLQPANVQDPLLLDTLVAMSLNGVAIYCIAWLLERFGLPLLRGPARLLFAIAPFTTLEPLAWLCKTGEYSSRFHWLFLALALLTAFLSRFRQRKSFYYAGLTNTAAALLLITDRYDWYDRPAWAMVIVGVSLLVLVLGFGLDTSERRRRSAMRE